MSKRVVRTVVLTTVVATSLTGMTLSTTTSAVAAVVNATPVSAFPTSTWTPPSSDPSGITFVPGKGLLISDAEVEEVPPFGLNQDTNLFYSTLAGLNNGLNDDGTTLLPSRANAWSKEPTGVAYVAKAGNLWNGHLFVTDDDNKRVFDISSAGPDGRFGTGDDGSLTSFRATAFGNTDPEDVAFDSTHNELWLAGGLSTIVSRVNPGADNDFTTAADNVTKNFEIPDLNPDPLKPPSPEGMAYDPERQTIYVLDGGAEVIFELAHNGAVLNQINLASINMQSVGGITLDPASTGSSRTFYIADRGLDPNPTRVPTCPTPTPPGCEAFNDGVVHVVQATMPPIGNLPPLADAGEDEVADTLEAVTLAGSGEDGTAPPAPAALTYSWTRVSGPGNVTLGTPNAPTTTASFSAAGDHVMRLTVSDGQSSDSDDMVVHVFAPAAPRSVNIPIRSGEDDGQESIGTGSSNGFTDLESADNELGHTNDTDLAGSQVLTGLRFTKLPVPKGSTIVDAKIQFSVDEASSSAASYVIRGQLAGNAPPLLHGSGAAKFNISSRTPTVASAAWNNVPQWTTIREEGPNQLTPQLAPILQEIVTQPTWARGNAVLLTIRNAAGNTGRRTAEAKDGRIPPYLTLTFRTPLTNTAPIVNAGADAKVLSVAGAASLAGTVTDDGKPGPVTTTWSKVSGPGAVSFATPNQLATTATFTQPGTYTLKLEANDGALSGSDDMQVTVGSATGGGGGGGGGGGTQAQQVSGALTASDVAVGERTLFKGTVSPAADGQPVQLQQRKKGDWVTVATKHLSAGSSSAYSFKIHPKVSGKFRYRTLVPAFAGRPSAAFDGPASGLLLRVYRAEITSVHQAGDEFVVIANTGAVPMDIDGWLLVNKGTSTKRTLTDLVVRPDHVVRIHSGAGKSDKNDLYLGGEAMWGKHATALLRNDRSVLLDKLSY